MAATGKGAEGLDLAARAMAEEYAAKLRRERRPEDPAIADEPVPKPRNP